MRGSRRIPTTPSLRYRACVLSQCSFQYDVPAPIHARPQISAPGMQRARAAAKMAVTDRRPREGRITKRRYVEPGVASSHCPLGPCCPPTGHPFSDTIGGSPTNGVATSSSTKPFRVLDLMLPISSTERAGLEKNDQVPASPEMIAHEGMGQRSSRNAHPTSRPPRGLFFRFLPRFRRT